MNQQNLLALREKWWFFPVAAYLLSRVLSTIMLWSLSFIQTGDTLKNINPKLANPNIGYGHIVNNWDGQWYGIIAVSGYPDGIPMDGDTPMKSVWAFYPLWSMLVRVVSLNGLIPVWLAATVLATVLGGISVVMLHRFMLDVSEKNNYKNGVFKARATTLWMCFLPISVVLSMNYTESLALFLLVCVMFCLHQRRYLLVLLPITALAFTRPVVLAVALLVMVIFVLRWRDKGDPFSIVDKGKLLLVAFYSVVSFGFWPMICWHVDGSWNSYLIAQSAWRDKSRIGSAFGYFISGDYKDFGVLLALVSLAVLMAFVVKQKEIPIELRVWAIVYSVYIYATGLTGTQKADGEDWVFNASIFRYLYLIMLPWIPFILLERITQNPKLKKPLIVMAFIGIPAAFWLYGFLVVINSDASNYWL